jgi:hypothetical protein
MAVDDPKPTSANATTKQKAPGDAEALNFFRLDRISIATTLPESTLEPLWG